MRLRDAFYDFRIDFQAAAQLLYPSKGGPLCKGPRPLFELLEGANGQLLLIHAGGRGLPSLIQTLRSNGLFPVAGLALQGWGHSLGSVPFPSRQGAFFLACSPHVDHTLLRLWPLLHDQGLELRVQALVMGGSSLGLPSSEAMSSVELLKLLHFYNLVYTRGQPLLYKLLLKPFLALCFFLLGQPVFSLLALQSFARGRPL